MPADDTAGRALQPRLPFCGELQDADHHLDKSDWLPARPTVVFETFWRFAVERQAVFFRRFRGATPPWTDDPFLRRHKFTNAYRASDRVSQYLIRSVIYHGDESACEVVFRALLFKLFNRIETWETLVEVCGPPSWRDFDFCRYDSALSRAMAHGPIYSAAYLMPAGRGSTGRGSKHRFHLELLDRMMRDELPSRLRDAGSMRQAFELLRAYPGIGDFLAYQYVTDINYSNVTEFSEMSFTVPGPGARDGLRKCFADLGGLTEPEMIRFVADRQRAAFGQMGLAFQDLWGRPLQLIDMQNLFCEVDKYARVAHPDVAGLSGRTRIKQRYSPNPCRIQYWYPPKWGLNDRVLAALGDPGEAT